ncbi:MAG TPA: DUF4864 domain-containing protein [Burkholderiaceae bacterium]|jgi:hypothetical protein|nr:DUF4864 domain-containing protein [Burkholderiaceae bacterium]
MKWRLWAILGFLFALEMPLSAPNAAAAPVAPADVKSIRHVVQSQLKALAEDDAAKAFSLATRSTRAQLGSADNFLQLIKEEYSPIYRNRLAIFSEAEIINGNTIQVVRITDRDSHVWVALYQMEREHDGSWKIDGCSLFETTSVSV